MIRSRSFIRVLSFPALALLSAACRDDRRETPAGPVEVTPDASVGAVAYLTISDSAPARGSTVIVTAIATGNDVTYGSFAANLTFAAAGLTYVGEAGNAGGMRAINPKPGDVAVAGVNLEGFADGELFAVELRVDNPAALASLALSVRELTSLDYRNEKPSLSVQKTVRLARAR